MPIAFAFLTIALLIKDTVPLGDVYILRTLCQGVALVIGLGWLFTQGSLEAVRRYWILGAYIIVLGGTVFVANNDEMRVALQVVSLLAISLFFISFCEQASRDPIYHLWASQIVVCALLLVCAGSLVLYKIAPDLTYDHTVERLTWDNVHRFKGLYGKPSGIAMTAGILFGLCVFTKVHWVIRGIGLLVSLPCLYLTLSRSFWVAALIGVLVTGAFYMRQKRVLVVGGVLCLVLGLIIVSVVDFKMTAVAESKVLRSDSLESMSGRTMIWKLAVDRFWDRPVLGYGYTVGHRALLLGHGKGGGGGTTEHVEVLQNETFSLHSGYVEALLDSGGLGVLLYSAVILSALWKMLRNDTDRLHAGVMYSLIFQSVSNFGESVIFSPSTFPAAFYWYTAILALGLGATSAKSVPTPELVSSPSPVISRDRYPLVSRPIHEGGS